jgi:hypothetical protein
MTYCDQLNFFVSTSMKASDCGPNLHDRRSVRSQDVLTVAPRPKGMASRGTRGLAMTAIVTPAIVAVVVGSWPSPAASQTANPPQVIAVCAQDFPTPTELACGAGSNATATGGGTTAVGVNAHANTINATAVGQASIANGNGSTSVGVIANTTGSWSTAIGNASMAAGTSATAVGDASKAIANFSSAFGEHSTAGGPNSTVVGGNSTANFANSMALGAGVSTTTANQIAVGTAANIYWLPGVTSAASSTSQTGVVSVVTTDPTGHLATMPVGGSPNAWVLGGNNIGATDHIGTINAMPFIVNTSGAGPANERMRITPTGWVGIGTPNPSLHFEVHQPVSPVMGISSATSQGRFGVASCGGCFSAVAAVDDFVLGNGSGVVRDLLLTSRSDNPAGGAIRFATGTISGTFPTDTEKMRLTKAGDLGVGTTSPTARTEISHSDLTPNTVALRVSNTNPTASAYTESAIGFNVALGGTGPNPNYFASRIYSKYDSSNVNDGRISMQVKNNGGALADVLNIKNGSVGINTITPLNPLHVIGTVRLGLAGPAPTHLCYTGPATSAVIADCPPSDARLKTNVLPLGNVLDKLQQVRGVSFEWNDQYRALGGSSERREIGVLAQEVEQVFPELVSVGTATTSESTTTG